MVVKSQQAHAGYPSRWPVLACCLLSALTILLAIFLGVVDIPPSQVAAVLLGDGSQIGGTIIVDIRLPRIISGILAGLHFAVAGYLLQTITRNPLADPSIMGISQGATLAVAIFLLAGVYLDDPGHHDVIALPLEWLPPIGMLGGLAAGGGIYFLALYRELGPLRITLCGVATGAVLHAIAIGLITGWGSDRIEILLRWLSGSLYARSWHHVVFLLPFTVIGLAALPFLRRPLQLLGFEAATARSFGLSYHRHFSIALLLSCILAASAVGTVGPIVFVGLVVPHLARLVVGRHVALHLPLVLILGPVFVTLGDLAGRLLGGAEEIPIGIITALCGAPVLLALLRRSS